MEDGVWHAGMPNQHRGQLVGADACQDANRLSARQRIVRQEDRAGPHRVFPYRRALARDQVDAVQPEAVEDFHGSGTAPTRRDGHLDPAVLCAPDRRAGAISHLLVASKEGAVHIEDEKL